MKPFEIYIGGQVLEGWTSATLSRTKDELTGTLDIDIFLGYLPGEPVFTAAVAGAPVDVYVGGNLALSGSVDRRKGTGKPHGEEGTKDSEPSGIQRSVNIGPDEYNIHLTCRGKTKILVDSSHRHPTTNMMQPTNREVFDKLIENTDVEIEWLSETINLDKVRFRDGNRVLGELHRVANENAHFIYETREGKLRITDDTARVFGDPLILGENILRFSSDQGEDKSRKEIRIKGQRSKKEIWGKKAVEEIMKTVSDSNTSNEAVITVQHYGDGTDEALSRRAQFEANKRTASSKTIEIEVFHVQPNGAPWDIGNVHYVEIPPEGICDMFECTGLKHVVEATDKIYTALTLSPLPSSAPESGAGNMLGLSGPAEYVSALAELANLVQARRAALNIQTQPGQYPMTWSGPELSVVTPKNSLYTLVEGILGGPKVKEKPPLRLEDRR